MLDFLKAEDLEMVMAAARWFEEHGDKARFQKYSDLYNKLKDR